MLVSVRISRFYWEASPKVKRKIEKNYFYPPLLSLHDVRNQRDMESKSWVAGFPCSAEMEQEDAGIYKIRPGEAEGGEKASRLGHSCRSQGGLSTETRCPSFSWSREPVWSPKGSFLGAWFRGTLVSFALASPMEIFISALGCLGKSQSSERNSSA